MAGGRPHHYCRTRPRSEERRVGKNCNIGVTGVQTSALPIYENRRIAALSFDLHDTDFPLQPSFPLLIYNLTNWFLPSPVAGNGQITPDTPVTIQTWPGADHITIAGPGQDRKSVV